MSTIAGVGAGLHAALMLARGRPEGVAVLTALPPDDHRIAGRSFWAMALTLPCFVCLRLLDWWQAGVPPHPGGQFALELLAYGISWIGFAVLTHSMARRIGRAALWPRYIAVWNWCNLVENLMQTAAAVLVMVGMPDWLTQTASLVATGWALWLEWFATRLALQVTGVQAAGLTALDFAMAAFTLGLVGTVG